MYPNPYESPDLNLPPKAFTSRCYAYRSGPWQSPASGVWTQVQFNAELFDLLAEFSIAVGAYNFVPTRAGYYLIIAQIYWDIALNTGLVEISLRINGTNSCYDVHIVPNGFSITNRIATIRYLTPNDTITLWCRQGTGGVRQIISGAAFSFITIQRLG